MIGIRNSYLTSHFTRYLMSYDQTGLEKEDNVRQSRRDAVRGCTTDRNQMGSFWGNRVLYVFMSGVLCSICVRPWLHCSFFNIDRHVRRCIVAGRGMMHGSSWVRMVTLYGCASVPGGLLSPENRCRAAGLQGFGDGTDLWALRRLKISAPHAGQFILSLRPPKCYLQPRSRCCKAQFRMYCLAPVFCRSVHPVGTGPWMPRAKEQQFSSAWRCTWRPLKSALMDSLIIWFVAETCEIVSGGMRRTRFICSYMTSHCERNGTTRNTL